ncbi:PREDICTED: protein UXT [Papilio polytes]|uniref:protein UXT n=1 Tax=Papilio polytes TaxID=76194 RepID=UPI000675C163|nr:PREDICTED: protein UXT [Papilio polytes]
MSLPNVDTAIVRYENFINNVLKESLRVQDQQLHKINEEITALIQEKHTLKVITDQKLHPDGFKTKLNIGCNFFMEASVPDTSKLLMHIGLKHYLEFTANEANTYLDARIKVYEDKAEEIKKKIYMTKAHIKLMLFGIGQLTNMKSDVKT